MNNKNLIVLKLEAFVRKFYINELIRGSLFFIGFGLFYFLFTLFVEYFLWLKPFYRTVLFYFFIFVEAFLLIRFIVFPIFKIFRIQKGINHFEASQIIGNHFSEVSDKLTNFLQLSANQTQSELLIASIAQKANSLQPIAFSKAIKFENNKKYLPLAFFPILIFLIFYLSGNGKIILQSFNRVIHYKAQFLPPAPFEFIILNKNLQTEQGKDFFLKVKTLGNIVPENAMIFIGNESYFLENLKPGEFQFRILKPISNLNFHLEANSVSSADFELKVIVVPAISNFEMLLNFPAYIKKKSETINGNGNAIVPEGTQITWKINTFATKRIDWISQNTSFAFQKNSAIFLLTKNINQNIEYQIFTSNNKIINYEKLNYQISVIKDQYPSIEVSHFPDSLKTEKSYVYGKISDDYGLSKLNVVYYPKSKPEQSKRGTMAIKAANFDQFVFSFPSNLTVEKGVSYDFYFEVFDNDAPHGYKSARSAVFSDRVATQSENENQNLLQQNANISGMSQSLKQQLKQLSSLEKLQKIGKEKDNLEFNDQQKVNDFLKQQIQQDQTMKMFSEKLKNNLDEFKNLEKDELKQNLESRLENAQQDLEKNKKLLDELKQLSDKINKEELFDKLEKFKQISKNQSKTLAQLLELTKSFYVTKKAEQIKERLDKLSEKQEQLSNKEKDNTVEKQNEINKDFDKIQQDSNDLQKENNELKTPIEIPNDSQKEKEIKDDLKKASDELKKDNQSKAKPRQKSAAKKMKDMSDKLELDLESGDLDQKEEDVKMLRQILDNLLAFSFSQEDLMNDFKSMKHNSPSFNKDLKTQQNLRQQFQHIDDSLFALSLRNPKIDEFVTKEIGNIHYNLDKSLENLAQFLISKGSSSQQYSITSANKLADMLSETLNSAQLELNMKGSGKGKPKPGKGKGSGMQLPDIIKKQDELAKKMQNNSKISEKPGADKDGKTGKDGKQTGEKGGLGLGENNSEGNAGEIMQIYKEQRQLREALENELKKIGLGPNGQNALDQMKSLEKQLLDKGFRIENLQKVNNIKQELLKLDNAIQEQGQEQKRQSNTNKKDFNNSATPLPIHIQEYLQSIEILGRDALPLRTNFNQKVQEYFKK